MTRHLRIYGTVQGVWYRESMREQAAILGLTGWVRNRRDGSVEAVVQGSSEAVLALIRWAHRGPPQAVVERVEENDGDASQPAFTTFTKLPSA